MPGKIPTTKKDFVPAGVPANIYNLVRALEQQYALHDKIAFFCKTSEEMQQCASYFFERAVINPDPRKFAAVAVKMLKFYPSEDLTKLTFKNALLGELKVKCYDAIFESNVSTERAVGIVKFFGELYNVELIISGILKKQFDALNERKTNCAKSRKCLYTLAETVKEKVRILLQTDQSTVVRRTIEMIEEVEANPQFYGDPPPPVAYIRKVPCKPIVQEPKTVEEKQKAFERLMAEMTTENSTDIVKKMKENHTYLFVDEYWKLAYKELVMKALEAPEFAGPVADICLKSLPIGTKKEDCRKLFYNILKTTISNGLIDECDEHLPGVMTFIDKMIDKKIVSISNIREIIDLIKTFQGDHSLLAAAYLVQLFEVIKLSKKIKQKKIQELDEDLRKDVIEIVKRSSTASEIGELEEYLFGDVSNELSAPSAPHVPKQMLPFTSRSEDKENSCTTAKKVRNKKKVYVDYFFGESRDCENSIQQVPEAQPASAWNALSTSYDDISKLLDEMNMIPDAANGEISETTSADLTTNSIKAAEADDDYDEFLRKEFPDLVQPSTDNSQQEIVNQPSSSTNGDVSEVLDIFNNADKEKAEQTKNSYSLTNDHNCQPDFDGFNQDFRLPEISNDTSRYAKESSRLMNLFKTKQTEIYSSPVHLTGASSSPSTCGSPASPFDSPVALSSNDYLVPSFNFSGLIDNFVKNEYANVKELVEQASTTREWDWKKLAEELLSKSLKEKDLDTYIHIGMLIAKTSPNFEKVLGDVALSALGNELGKEIALDFVVENESDETATCTANFISQLYDKSCLSDSQLYQCMSHIATGRFRNIRRVKIFIALLRPAASKIKKNLTKDVLADYLKTVKLSAIEPMKSTDQWIYSELIDLLKSITATMDEGNIFNERASYDIRPAMMTNQPIRTNSMAFPGPVRYFHRPEPQQLFDPRVFAYQVNHNHHMMRPPPGPFNNGNSPYFPSYMYEHPNKR